MRINSNNAIILKIEHRTFKKENTEVEYYPITFIDDDNNYHEATVVKEVIDSLDRPYTEILRLEAALTLDVEEVTRNGHTTLKKRVVSIS